jgi:hypothetical protein
MTKEKIMYYLDFVPLVILTISAIILVWTVFETDTVFAWKHFVGLVLLPINYFLFWWRHKLGVVGLGLTILLGLVSLLSFDHSITTSTVTVGKELSVPIFYGQPIFLLWFIIHFVLSFRHYVGVLAKKYWQELFHNLSRRSV